MDLKVDSTSDGQVLTLVGRGEIDYATLDVLEGELDKATASDAETVVVDMRDVTYIDSAGLGVLVKAHRRMTSQNRALVLRVTSPDIIKLFEITGLAHLFAVEMPYDADGAQDHREHRVLSRPSPRSVRRVMCADGAPGYRRDMVTNTRTVNTTPDQVWDVLADGWLYPLWVVGATRMRDVDQDWPAVGLEDPPLRRRLAGRARRRHRGARVRAGPLAAAAGPGLAARRGRGGDPAERPGRGHARGDLRGRRRRPRHAACPSRCGARRSRCATSRPCAGSPLLAEGRTPR